MKKCPFCEWEVSETAKKCKHCWEWIKENVYSVDENDNKRQLTKWGKKVWNNVWKSQSKIQKFLSDYWILLVIWAVVLYAAIFGRGGKNDGSVAHQESNNDVSVSTYELIGDNDDIIKTEKWFTIFPNSIWECDIDWEKEIKKFVEAVKEAKDWEIVKRTCKNQNITVNDNWNNVAFLFDNSYSQDLNWNIDKKWPYNRMLSMWNYLNNRNFPDLSILDFVFIFTIKPEDNSEEPDGNLYHFSINPSAFTTEYIKEWNWEPFYDDKRKKLIYRNDVKLNVSVSWWNNIKCIVNGSNSFVCYDTDSVYEKIYEIYSKEYDVDSKHTNNMFMKTLAMNNDRFYWWNKDEVYIFTNWEFKIWYEREKMYLSKLKQKYKDQRKHDGWADKTHNLTEFNMRYANRYQKDGKYESFWLETIDALRSQLPVCEWIKIHVIWLTRSAEFKPLAEKIYSKIFEPCEVLFQ